MSGKELYLNKEFTRSHLTAICAFEAPFCAYLLCGSLLKFNIRVSRSAFESVIKRKLES